MPLSNVTPIDELASSQQVAKIVQEIQTPKPKEVSPFEKANRKESLAAGMVATLGDKGTNLYEEASPEVMEQAYAKVAPGEFVPRYDSFMKGINNEELNAQAQSGWAQLGNGVMKNLAKAGMYVLDGTVGTVVGVTEGIAAGSLSAATNNTFSTWMDEQNKRLDYALPNYVTENEKNMNWLKAAVTGNTNFWANDVLGGVAFMAGAMGSEFLWAAATGGSSLALSGSKLALRGSKALGLADDAAKLATSTKKMMSAYARTIPTSTALKGLNNTRFILTSAGFEAAVESRSSLDESIANFQEAIQLQYGRTPTAEEYSEFLPDAVNQSNKVFAANMAILAPSNIVMFGSMFNINPKLPKTISKLANKSVGIGLNTVDEAGKVVYKAINPTKTQKYLGYTTAVLKNPLTEGLYEEGMQSVASKGSQNFLAAKYDPSSLKEGYDDVSAFRDAFNQTYNTQEGWKEIGIGMIIGAMGGTRGAIKDYSKGVKNQEALAVGLNSMQNTMTKATEGTMRRFLDTVQANTMLKKANSAAAEASPLAPMYFDQAQFAKMQMENRAGMLDESVANFEKILSGMPAESLMSEYGIDATQVDEVKATMLEDYKYNVAEFKNARRIAEALAPTVDNFSDKGGKAIDFTDELALNIYLGSRSAAVADSLASDIQAAIGEEGLADHLKFYGGVSNEAKNAAEAVRVAQKRILSLDEEYAKLQQEYSVLLETAPRTEENTAHAKRVEANRRKAGKTLEIRTERATELVELKAKLEKTPSKLGFAFDNTFEKPYTTADNLVASIEALGKLDEFLIELEKRNPRAAANVTHMIQEYASNVNAFEQFSTMFNKLSDRSFNFNSYKGAAKFFNTTGKYGKPKKTNLSPDEQVVEDFIAANNLTEYDAFQYRLLKDLSNAIYSDAFTNNPDFDFKDPISLTDWAKFIETGEASEEVLDELARKTFENSPLTNREERIKESHLQSVEDKVTALKKERGDSLRKAKKKNPITAKTGLSSSQILRDLIDQILKSKNYLSHFDTNDITNVDVPTEAEYREVNKLENIKQTKGLSAKNQKRYDELKAKMNKWGAIEGTFAGKHSLGELYKLLFILEQSNQETVSDETAEIPLTETVHEEILEGSDRGDNYNHLQTYDKAFFIKDKDDRIAVSNISLNGFIEILNTAGFPIKFIYKGTKQYLPSEKFKAKRGDSISVVFTNPSGVEEKIFFLIGKRGNIEMTSKTKDWLNENTPIKIVPPLTENKLPTNYFTILRRIIQNGINKLIPVDTDFTLDKHVKFDVSKIQNLKKGDVLHMETSLVNEYNKELIAKYKAAPDKTAALEELAKDLNIRFVDGQNNLVGILKAEYDVDSANVKSDFVAVSNIRREAAQKLVDALEDDIEVLDLEMSTKVVHVYHGHPILDIAETSPGNFELTYNRFTDDNLDNIVDVGYIENGVIHLKNKTAKTTDSYIHSIKKDRNGKYKNKRVPVVVFSFNGLNIVYPVKLVPTVVDGSPEIDRIMGTTLDNNVKAQQINEYLIQNGIDVEPLQIRGDTLTKQKIEEIKKLLISQKKFVNLQEWIKPDSDMRQTLKDNASIHLDLMGDVFHSPKVVVDIQNYGIAEPPTMEGEESLFPTAPISPATSPAIAPPVAPSITPSFTPSQLNEVVEYDGEDYNITHQNGKVVKVTRVDKSGGKPFLISDNSLIKNISDVYEEQYQPSPIVVEKMIIIPSAGTYQPAKEMKFIDGQWQQRIGREYTPVAKSVQNMAEKLYNEKVAAAPIITTELSESVNKKKNKKC